MYSYVEPGKNPTNVTSICKRIPVMTKAKINDRSKHILKALVALYIRDGQPIGSKTIVEEAGVQLSSATIRSILADLEEHGYLTSPYTSSGRVPTELGYRFFVDCILQVNSNYSAIKLEEIQLSPDVSDQQLVETASNIISKVTQLTGIVTMPKRDQVILRHIEFLPLSHQRVLVILVINEHEVHNLIIHTEKEYTVSELQQYANFLIAHYAGLNLFDVRRAVLDAMHSDHDTIEAMMRGVFTLAEQTFQRQQEDYVITGESNLLTMAEETGVDKLRSLFNAFSQKQDMLHLLDRCLQTQGIQIFIGKESGHQVLDGCSLVTAPYQLDGKVLGVLGVIGPTRMDYERVISAVDITSKLMSAALKDRINTSE